MLHPEADTGSSILCWSKKEQTVSKCALLTTRTVASHKSEILASVGNYVLCVRANDNGNMSSVLTG